MKKNLLLASSIAVAVASQSTYAAPVDIAFVVDQSVSMRGEFDWIPTVIGEIDTALQSIDRIDSTRYGVVGYMENAYQRNNGTSLAYQDLTSDVSLVQNEVGNAPLYASRESGYEAAYWSMNGFSWADDAVKIMILLTDEPGDQFSDIGTVPIGTSKESHLGSLLDDDGILLNVITRTNLYSQWDEAVFDINSSYEGLFNIADLRNNADAFTAAFVDAKVGEIIGEIDDDEDDDNVASVPEPGTLGLLGLGLAGLGLTRRKQKSM